MQTQDNTKMCYRRGNQRTWKETSPQSSKSKSIHQKIKAEHMNNKRPSKSKLIHQKIKLEYMNKKRPFKPNLPNVLEPSKLLLPMDFSKSCLLQLSRSPTTTNCIRQASPTSFGKSPKLPKFQNTLYPLKMCGLCLSTNLFSRYDNGRGKEKRL